MLLKRLGFAVLAATLLITVGCERGESDKRLIDIAVKVEKQGARVDQIGTRMEGIEASLAEIRASLQRAEPAVRGETQAVDFRDTPEYKQMAAALSAVEQQLNITQSGLAETQEEFEKEQEVAKKKAAQKKPFGGVNDPQKLTEKLDSLAQSFALGVNDPVRRQELEAEVEQLKRDLSDNLSAHELYEPLVSDLTERLNSE